MQPMCGEKKQTLAINLSALRQRRFSRIFRGGRRDAASSATGKQTVNSLLRPARRDMLDVREEKHESGGWTLSFFSWWEGCTQTVRMAGKLSGM